jgi:hypothetical protein
LHSSWRTRSHPSPTTAAKPWVPSEVRLAQLRSEERCDEPCRLPEPREEPSCRSALAWCASGPFKACDGPRDESGRDCWCVLPPAYGLPNCPADAARRWPATPPRGRWLATPPRGRWPATPPRGLRAPGPRAARDAADPGGLCRGWLPCTTECGLRAAAEFPKVPL